MTNYQNENQFGYNEVDNEIYAVQTFLKDEMSKSMDKQKDTKNKQSGGTKSLTALMNPNKMDPQMRSEARLNAFKQYFAKYSKRAASIQFSNEQSTRNVQRLAVKRALLDDIHLTNEDISEQIEADIEDDEFIKNDISHIVSGRLKRNFLEISTDKALQHKATRDIVSHTHLSRTADYLNNNTDTIDVNKAHINERKYQLVTLDTMAIKPKFVRNQMAEQDYHEMLFQAQVDYLILKMSNPDFVKPDELHKFSDDSALSWVEQFKVDEYDSLSLDQITNAAAELQAKAAEYSLLSLNQQSSFNIEPSAPLMPKEQDYDSGSLVNMSMFGAGENEPTNDLRTKLSI